jgi:plasmid stabilization system protein ParE
MQILVAPAAERQIQEIDGWWRENRTASPDLFAQELAAAIALIETWPQVGRRRRHRGVPGLRRVLLRSTRYHLYYAPVSDDRLFVLAVWSAVRQRGPKLPSPQ